MNAAPQHQPTSAIHSTTIAAGPQSAPGIPSAGVAPARPAALFLRWGGIEHLVCRLDLRVPRAGEHEMSDFVLVPDATERDLYWEVTRELNDALCYGGER